MKISLNQTVFIKNQDEKYQCGSCKYWIEGIGNWGGCTAVLAAPNAKVEGLHIHRKASCKYWQKGSPDLAIEQDQLAQRFTQEQALYGAIKDKPASPVGFSCKNCEYWGESSRSCVKFSNDEVLIEENDCSDGWQPNERALDRINKYEDQLPPESVDNAITLSELYGQFIGDEMNRGDGVENIKFVADAEKSLNNDELENLIKTLKSKSDEQLKIFYKSVPDLAVGTKRFFGGVAYIKSENGWDKEV
jgi:hypothetical protein